MGTISIAHDSAFVCAVAIMERIRPVFRDEEVRDAWELIYQHVKAAVEAAFAQRTKELQRLHPHNCN